MWYLKRGLLKASSQCIQQSGLSSSWRPQKKSDATRTKHATHVIQNAEVLLVWLHDAYSLQDALQSGSESADKAAESQAHKQLQT